MADDKYEDGSNDDVPASLYDPAEEIADLYARLRRAGWSVGSTAAARRTSRRVWLAVMAWSLPPLLFPKPRLGTTARMGRRDERRYRAVALADGVGAARPPG